MPCRLRTGLEHLTDFRQQDSEVTQSRLVAERDELTSSINDRRYRVGRLSMPTLERTASASQRALGKRSTVAASPRTYESFTRSRNSKGPGMADGAVVGDDVADDQRSRTSGLVEITVHRHRRGVATLERLIAEHYKVDVTASRRRTMPPTPTGSGTPPPRPEPCCAPASLRTCITTSLDAG